VNGVRALEDDRLDHFPDGLVELGGIEPPCIRAWRSMNGQQGGDPAKLAAALVTITELDTPPLRFVAGADAVAAVEHKAKDLLAQIDAHRALSTALAYDDGAS
jgi:hypothetical protein